MSLILARDYGNASFLINRETMHSVFLEGPLATFAPRLIDAPNYSLPYGYIQDLNKTDKNKVLADFDKIQRAVKALFEPSKCKREKKRSSKKKNAMEELSAYAIKNWQIVNVNLELTYLCNQRCSWCYLDDFSKKGMTRKRLNILLDDLKMIGALFILLTGGEIFLRPDVLDIIEDINNAGFVTELKTNGTLLKPKMIERLANFNPFDIQISIYGTDTGYFDQTNSFYRFDLIRENARIMVENGMPVTLSVLVGKHNIDSIEKIHESLIDIGAEVFYSPYITPKRNCNGRKVPLRLTSRDMEQKLLPFLERIDALPVQKKYRNCDEDSTVCYAGRDQIAISPLGRVFPCLDLAVPLGDLSKEPLSDILARRKSILEKFTLRDMPKCIKCADRDYCDSCIGVALLENNDYRKPSRHKCDVVKFYAHNRI
jgi:radical SAM protein with 4Fe4S-binding SPASM domain